MDATRFVIIRHGETEWNVDGREMGQLDSPLTPLGVAQAEGLARRVAATRFDALYSSDLGRAVKTATIIARLCSREVLFDARLRERNMGIFQGLTHAEMESKYPAERAEYRKEGSSYVIPSGESADERVQRALDCLEELAGQHAGGTLVIITHGGILMGLFEHVLGLPFGSGGKFRRPNAAWNVFTRERARWILETWGDVSHISVDPPSPVPPHLSRDERAR